ncbi:unnamed protein product, partial [Amoebophrya sp. A120]
ARRGILNLESNKRYHNNNFRTTTSTDNRPARTGPENNKQDKDQEPFHLRSSFGGPT